MIQKINTILFDLDGTLTDPMEGITKAVQYALKRYGIIEDDLWNLTKFIGPPLSESFEQFYGFTKEDALQAVEVYREYFGPIGKFQNEVYEGIPELLKELKEQGFTVALATSKPEVFAREILEHFHLDSYFDFAGGALFHGRGSKAEVISYVLEELNAEKERVMMVGDRMHDVEGAKKNGLPCIGVLYGYGSREELKEAGAVMVLETVEELRKQLLSYADC